MCFRNGCDRTGVPADEEERLSVDDFGKENLCEIVGHEYEQEGGPCSERAIAYDLSIYGHIVAYQLDFVS